MTIVNINELFNLAYPIMCSEIIKFLIINHKKYNLLI